MHVASGEGHGEGLARLVEQLVDEHERQGHAAASRRGVRPAAAAGLGAALPRQGGPAAGRHAARQRHRPPQRRAPGGRRRAGAAPLRHRRARAARRPAAALRRAAGRRGPARPARCSSPTPPTTSCAGSTSTPARRSRSPAPDGCGGRATPTAGPAREVDLSTPWDLAEHDGEVVLAMAGTHQLWALSAGRAGARPGRHDRRGAARRRRDAGLPGAAERPGLRTASGCGSPTPRRARCGGTGAPTDGRGEVGTAVGSGLFDFGHVDGPAAQALLQHPLGRGAAARRQRRRLRHLQRRGPALRPGDRRGDDARDRRRRAERRGGRRRRRSWSSRAPPTGSSGRSRRAPWPGSAARRSSTSRPVTDLAAGPVRLDGRSSSRRPASTSTSGTVRRPGSSSPPRRRSCSSRAPAPAPGSRAALVLAGDRGRPARRGHRGVLRRGRRAPGLPHHAAGLGHPGAARRRRAATALEPGPARPGRLSLADDDGPRPRGRGTGPHGRAQRASRRRGRA